MDLVLEKIIGDIKYQVVYDDLEDFDIDFESEQERQDYIALFAKGELTAYGVLKFRGCPCCNCWKDVDSLWGLHFANAEECLEYYVKNYHVEE